MGCGGWRWRRWAARSWWWQLRVGLLKLRVGLLKLRVGLLDRTLSLAASCNEMGYTKVRMQTLLIGLWTGSPLATHVSIQCLSDSRSYT
jgi:hypothetical protein